MKPNQIVLKFKRIDFDSCATPGIAVYLKSNYSRFATA